MSMIAAFPYTQVFDLNIGPSFVQDLLADKLLLQIYCRRNADAAPADANFLFSGLQSVEFVANVESGLPTGPGLLWLDGESGDSDAKTYSVRSNQGILRIRAISVEEIDDPWSIQW